MIKNGLKNYFKNLKHFFTPIGTLAVGMFIGLSILIPGALAIFSALVERLAEILENATFDFSTLKDAVLDAIRALDWNDPIAALKIMLSREWLNGVVNECLNVVAGGLQPYADAINEAVGGAMSGIYALFALFLTFSVIGLICGYFLTRFLVRRNMAKRTLKKFLFAVFVDSLVTALLISLCLWLVTLWGPSIYISSVITLLIFGSVALISAYQVHGRKKVPFQTVLNFKNVFKLLLINAVIFIISLVFLALTVLITNVIAGVLIGFSFVEIAFIVMSLNAESYVVQLVSDSTAQTEPPVTEEDIQSVLEQTEQPPDVA